MSERRLLHKNGKKSVWWKDDGDQAHVWNEYADGDVDAIDAAKHASEANEGKKHDGWRHEAIVPAHVLADAMRDGWFHDTEAWRRWANSPSNAHCRVQHGGRIKRL